MKVSKFYWIMPLIFIALEGFLPLSAQANDWFYLTTAEDNEFHVFLDQTSINRRGSIVSARTMFTNQQADEYGAVATIHLEEYDCDKQQHRFLQLTVLYDDQSVWTDREGLSGEWQPVQPQSIGEALFEISCSSNQSQ
jgi:hypothetical protein